MSPKDDNRIKIIMWIMGIGLTLIFSILIALMPMINNNAKAATEALTETKNIKEIINVKFENIEEKLGIHIEQSEEQIESLKILIENNRLNHAEVAGKLLENGYIKDITFRNGKSD